MSAGKAEQWLELTTHLHDELGVALRSLKGKPFGAHELFKFYCAQHIFRAVQGYLSLKKSGLRADVLLVRPTIEALFRMAAVEKNPAMLFQIAYTESLEEERLIRLMGAPAKDGVLAKITGERNSFRASYAQRFPTHILVERKIRVVELAQSAGLNEVYDTHYRLFCQATHGALRAITSKKEELPEECPTIAICAIAALEIVVAHGGSSSNLGTFKGRLAELSSS